MAEPLLAETATDDAERSASETEARMVRGVRWRLVAWSGGSTLVVLLALGIALYLSVASSLQATAVANLDQRASDIESFVNGCPCKLGGMTTMQLLTDLHLPSVGGEHGQNRGEINTARARFRIRDQASPYHVRRRH